MKTLCLSLGLLLLVACCCDAMPKALRFHMARRNCCGTVSPHRIRSNQVIGITKTPGSCEKEAFIIHTVKGKRICYSQTSQWAQAIWKKLHQTEDGNTSTTQQ